MTPAIAAAFFTNKPTLYGERSTLRPFQPQDIAAMAGILRGECRLARAGRARHQDPRRCAAQRLVGGQHLPTLSDRGCSSAQPPPRYPGDLASISWCSPRPRSSIWPASDWAAFVVDDLVSVQPWRVRCLEIRGVAEALTTEGGPLIRLHPKRIISFGVDEPEMEAHRLTSNNRDVG